MQAILQTVDPAVGTLGNATTLPGSISPTIDLMKTTGDSTLSPPTIAHVAGVVDEIDLRLRRVEENISSLGDTHANHILIATDAELIVTEILRQGANTCLWANLWTASDPAQNLSRIVLAKFARAGKLWQGYFLMQGYPEMLRRGKTVARMRLQIVDPGQVNPSYTVADR